MSISANDNTAIGREETLAALPRLLSFARQVVITAFEPGDPEIDEFRALLDECVVGAHRIYLREQLAAGAELQGEGI